MSALRTKDTRALLDDLIRQGATTKQTSKGVRVLFPDGSSYQLHRTTSDHRSTLNTRAAVLRAGLTWPNDKTPRKGTMGTRIEPERRAELARVVSLYKDGPVSAATIAKMAGVSPPTAMKVLHQAGFTQVSRGKWERRSRRQGQPPIMAAPVAAPEVPAEEGGELPESVIAAPEPVVEAPPLPPEAPPALPFDKPREFIDDANSWTIDVPKKLQEMAAEMGLNIEVRVWR